MKERVTIVETSAGLLYLYEYTMSYSGTTYSNVYLNNGLYWWTLTPYSTVNNWNIESNGNIEKRRTLSDSLGVRPSINLKSDIKIIDGNGTKEDPYRLEGDNDTNLSGTLLNTRYSGEYITFGTGENNLYRIVSHENSIGTKITSTEPLKSGGSFITSAFGNNTTFSSTNTVGLFLNGDYLTSYVGDSYNNMIEDSTIWYLGPVEKGSSYKLAKYTDTNMSSLTSSTTEAKVGLLRLGELMAGQYKSYENNIYYWLLTPYGISTVWNISNGSGYVPSITPSDLAAIRPSLNLKSNVIITSGDGTLQKPFQITLAN